MLLKSLQYAFLDIEKIPPEQSSEIVRRLENELLKLIDEDYETYLTGGALGFDTIAAQTFINLKQQYLLTKLILALPCLSQSKNWSDSGKQMYEDVKGQADKIVYTSHKYTR